MTPMINIPRPKNYHYHAREMEKCFPHIGPEQTFHLQYLRWFRAQKFILGTMFFYLSMPYIWYCLWHQYCPLVQQYRQSYRLALYLQAKSNIDIICDVPSIVSLTNTFAYGQTLRYIIYLYLRHNLTRYSMEVRSLTKCFCLWANPQIY